MNHQFFLYQWSHPLRYLARLLMKNCQWLGPPEKRFMQLEMEGEGYELGVLEWKLPQGNAM